jgi:Cu/Ag efflux protein CusF
MKIRKSLAISVLGLTLFSACSKQENPQPPAQDSAKIGAGPIKEGQGKGIVRGIDTTTKIITLDHGNIPNVMDAMTMDYHADPSELLRSVKVGDSVSFTAQDRGQGYFAVTAIAEIRK